MKEVRRLLALASAALLALPLYAQTPRNGCELQIPRCEPAVRLGIAVTLGSADGDQRSDLEADVKALALEKLARTTLRRIGLHSRQQKTLRAIGIAPKHVSVLDDHETPGSRIPLRWRLHCSLEQASKERTLRTIG